jgi:hypothetical protein
LVSAPALGAGGRRFKSGRPDHRAPYAQLSGLSSSAKLRRRAERIPASPLLRTQYSARSHHRLRSHLACFNSSTATATTTPEPLLHTARQGAAPWCGRDRDGECGRGGVAVAGVYLDASPASRGLGRTGPGSASPSGTLPRSSFCLMARSNLVPGRRRAGRGGLGPGGLEGTRPALDAARPHPHRRLRRPRRPLPAGPPRRGPPPPAS